MERLGWAPGLAGPYPELLSSSVLATIVHRDASPSLNRASCRCPQHSGRHSGLPLAPLSAGHQCPIPPRVRVCLYLLRCLCAFWQEERRGYLGPPQGHSQLVLLTLFFKKSRLGLESWAPPAAGHTHRVLRVAFCNQPPFVLTGELSTVTCTPSFLIVHN